MCETDFQEYELLVEHYEQNDRMIHMVDSKIPKFKAFFAEQYQASHTSFQENHVCLIMCVYIYAHITSSNNHPS